MFEILKMFFFFNIYIFLYQLLFSFSILLIILLKFGHSCMKCFNTKAVKSGAQSLNIYLNSFDIL